MPLPDLYPYARVTIIKKARFVCMKRFLAHVTYGLSMYTLRKKSRCNVLRLIESPLVTILVGVRVGALARVRADTGVTTVVVVVVLFILFLAFVFFGEQEKPKPASAGQQNQDYHGNNS
jgi:hypothetical protein